jgi:hypothetical protein
VFPFESHCAPQKFQDCAPGLNLALEGLREALRERKATAAEIARYARDAGIWKVVQPYLEAMTANALEEAEAADQKHGCVRSVALAESLEAAPPAISNGAYPLRS